MGRDSARRASPLDKGKIIVIQAVRDFLVNHEIRRFRAVIATVLLGAWVIASVILMDARLTVPDNTSTSVDTSVSTLKQPGASHAESILNSKGRARELSTNLSVSLRDGNCLAVTTAELRLTKDDPLFAALETGRLSPYESQKALGDVVIGKALRPYDDVVKQPSTFQSFPVLDAVHIDKKSNTATMIYRDDTQFSSSHGCGSSFRVEYRCGEPQYCPSSRAFTLTVGTGLGIDHVVEGLADTQRRDHVIFTELKSYQGIAVIISLRDQTIQADTSIIEELIDVLSTSLWDGDFSLALVVPLVILALSKTRRYSLDVATRSITSLIIYSTACALLAAPLFFYAVYPPAYPQPIEDAAAVLLAVSEIARPSLALLVLVLVFVALPLTLSILVARRHGQNINRSIWIFIISIACGPLIVAAVTQVLGGALLSPQEVVLVVIVVTLPIMVMIALRSIRWNLIHLSMLTGILTAIFATSVFPDGGLSIGVLAFSFPLAAIPLCILYDRRRTTRSALLFILTTMIGVLELVVVSFWYLEELSSFPVDIYEPIEWAAVILFPLELTLFVLLVLMMIGGTPTAASMGTATMVDRRSVVMILTFMCAFIFTYSFDSPTLGNTLGIALSTLLFGFLVIRSLTDVQSDLWNISSSAHTRLVQREARRRVLFKVSRDHARDGKQRISEGAYELREFDRNQRHFDRQADPRLPSGIAQNLSLPEAALGSVGGFTASQNARVACIFALVTCLPAMLPGLIGIWGGLPEATVVLLGIFRWVIYACVFGYYYPAIRGSTPTSKSLTLFVAVAIPEVVWLISEDLPMNEFTLLATARLGQAAVLCFGLGLFWERRLVQAAGLGWGRIRDFRALRGLATPVITVAIAAATTVATGLAGATLTSIVQPEAPNQTEDPNRTVAPAPPGTGPR